MRCVFLFSLIKRVSSYSPEEEEDIVISRHKPYMLEPVETIMGMIAHEEDKKSYADSYRAKVAEEGRKSKEHAKLYTGMMKSHPNLYVPLKPGEQDPDELLKAALKPRPPSSLVDNSCVDIQKCGELCLRERTNLVSWNSWHLRRKPAIRDTFCKIGCCFRNSKSHVLCSKACFELFQNDADVSSKYTSCYRGCEMRCRYHIYSYAPIDTCPPLINALRNRLVLPNEALADV